MTELYLFNKEEVLINIIPEDDFNNDSHVRELNSKWSFEFTTTFQYLNDLSKSNKVGFYDRYREFRLFKIIKEPEVDYLSNEVVVNCLNDCYEMSDQIIEDKRLRDGTARQALDKVLEGSSYEVGEVAELGNRTINFYDISRMEGLNNIIESYGGELDYRIEFDADFKRISHKYVDIKSRLGQDTGLRFTYDLNLESVVRKDVSESHCTVLYGRGGAIESGDGYSRKIKFTDVEWKKPTNPIDKPIGQTYIEDLDAIAKYGRIEGIYENSDIEEPGELLQATYEALQECKNPKLSYEVNAKDLASQNSDYDHLTVVLGDSVILLDEDYDLNLESRIVGFEESIKEESAEMKWIIGNVQSSFSSDNASSGQIIKPSTGDVDIEIDDDKFPDALPDVPIIEAEGLFGSVIISWTYESKSYYEYELYASKLESFNPDASNLIFRGKASSYHHQVKPSETWYYRARAINTHGRTTDFSSQVKASTLKIEDGTEYFEKAAIADALIGELRLDRGWVGQLRGNWIDAKQLSVTDGNGKRTLDIDSFGNVNLDVTSLKIKSNSVATQSQVQQTADNIQFKFTQTGGYNLIRNGNPKPNNYSHWWVSGNANWYLGSTTDIGVQTLDTNEAYAGSATFKVEPGKTYSFSCWLMAETNTKGTDVYFIGSANDDGAYTEVHNLYTSSSGDQTWHQVKASFTVGSNINYGFIRIDNNGRKDTSNGAFTVVFFSEVMLVKGQDYFPQWSPNPNEVYDGITTIDKSGIKVNASNINGYTKMTANGFFVNKDGKDLASVDGYGLRLFDAKIQLTHANGNKYFLLDENGIVMYNPANGTHQWGKVAAINNKFTVASNGNSSGLSLGHHVNENYVEDILCDSNGVVSVQRQMNHNGVFYNNYGQMFVRQSGQGGWEITGRSDSQSIKPGGANQGGIGSNTQYINQSWIANRQNPSSLEYKHLSHYVEDLECIKLVSEVQPARYFYKEYDEEGNDITTFTTRTSQLGLIYEDVRECEGRDLITNEEDKAINLYNMVSTLWGAVRNLNKRLNELEVENLDLKSKLTAVEDL